MSTATYTVTGMTCGHCVSSVTEEVSALPGIAEVHVDLQAGAVTVTGDAAQDVEAVRSAVEDAGYTLVEPA